MSSHYDANQTAFQGHSFSDEQLLIEAVKVLYRTLKANQQPARVVPAEFYSSSKLGELPPGCESKRQFIDRCRNGDLRTIAKKDSRAWVVEKLAYQVHLETYQTKSSRAKGLILNEIEADELRQKQIADALSRSVRKRGAR